MAKVFAFDVDDTLEISNGPIKIQDLVDLRNQDHIVGLCGNWGKFFQCVPQWYQLLQFFNYGQLKNVFLYEIRLWIPGMEDYVMVGNIGPLDSRTYNVPQTGGSDDMSQALAANWRFIKESDFAAGVR
jgi:hypothetical protein